LSLADLLGCRRRAVVWGATMKRAHYRAREHGLDRKRDTVIYLTPSSRPGTLMGVHVEEWEAIGLTREELTHARYHR